MNYFDGNNGSPISWLHFEQTWNITTNLASAGEDHSTFDYEKIYEKWFIAYALFCHYLEEKAEQRYFDLIHNVYRLARLVCV